MCSRLLSSHITDLDEKNRETHSVLLGSLGAKGAFPVVAIVTSGSFKVELELDIVVVVVKKGLAVVVVGSAKAASSLLVVVDVIGDASRFFSSLPVGHFLLRSKVEETNACQTGPRTFGVLSLLS